jgi:hypothetical protein
MTAPLTAPDDRLPGVDNVDVSALRSLSFPRSQFVLFGAAPQLASFRPDIVCIDYDPWHIDPTWAKLVRSLVDGGECFADVVG